MLRVTSLLLTLVAMLMLTASASAAPAYKGSSNDGRIVFFETDEQLVPGDTDAKRDVYERFYDDEVGIKSYVTREISLGPAGGNDAFNATFEKASADGTVVFFSTEEALVEEDADRRMDVYMREPEGGETTLVSQGAAGCSPCGNGPFDAGFAGASSDGEEAFFVSQEELVGADKDNSVDIYERDLSGDGETKLISTGTCTPECGNGPHDAALRGVSADGSHVYFTTEEALSPFDHDSVSDIYARDVTGAGETTLVSQAGEGCGGCGNGSKVPVYRGSSEDVSRVFFTTDEKLVGADTDTATDIYARDLPGGPTMLVSGASSTKTVSYAAASATGAHAFFTTDESLVGEDEDTVNDVYEWSGGAPTLVTTAECTSACGATFDAVSPDSNTVLFSTAARLDGEDTDSNIDIYSQQVGGGAPLLVSRGEGSCAPVCGNDAFDARFPNLSDRASADTSHVVFTSAEALSAEDVDIEDDIYVRDVSKGETSLVTMSSQGVCPLEQGKCGATVVDSSAGGDRVFFTSAERFTTEDPDSELDIYERFLAPDPADDVTRLVSTGNSLDLELGPPAPKLESTSPASPGASITPKIIGTAAANARVKIYATSNCSGEPVAHGSASQLASPGIGVTVKVGHAAKFWATAEAEGFVSLCSSPISYTQQDPSSGEGGNEGGGQQGDGGGTSAPTTGTEKVSTLKPPPATPQYLTPRTRITFAPAEKTRKRNPVFRFIDLTEQVGTKFSCKLDRNAWKHCISPLQLKHLSRGPHLLEIKAVNAAGAAEPRPATRRFKVVPR